MSNIIKSIRLQDVSKDYKQGTTILNANHIVKMYPKPYAYYDSETPKVDNAGNVVNYHTLVIIDSNGEKTECFRNCRDKAQIDEIINRFFMYLGTEAEIAFDIPIFAPLADYDIHGTKGSK